MFDFSFISNLGHYYLQCVRQWSYSFFPQSISCKTLEPLLVTTQNHSYIRWEYYSCLHVEKVKLLIVQVSKTCWQCRMTVLSCMSMVLERNVSHWHFVHHKSHTDYPEFEFWPAEWKTSNSLTTWAMAWPQDYEWLWVCMWVNKWRNGYVCVYMYICLCMHWYTF